MKKLDGGPALLFAKVNGYDMPVIGNLLSCQANVEAAFGIDFRGVREFVGRALGEPKPPVLVERAPAQEHVHTQEHRHRPDAAGAAAHRRRRRALHHRRHRHRPRSRDRRLQRVLSPADAGRPQPRRHPARFRPPSAGGVRARPEEGPASAGRGLHRRGPRAALHRGDHGLADARERRRACGRRRPVRTAAAGGEGRIAGPAGAGRKRDRAGGRAEVRRGDRWKARSASSSAIWRRPILRPVLEVTALTHRDQADLSRHQRLRPRDRGAAQVRAGGEPAQGAASRRCRSSPTPR